MLQRKSLGGMWD